MATSDDETARITVIQFCVETGMTTDTDFKWHERFRKGWTGSLQRGSHSRAHGDIWTDGECSILLEGKSFLIDLTDSFHFVSISELIC